MLLSKCLTGYGRFVEEIIEKNLLEYLWVVTYVVTIFFWSSPSLVFEVFAMASRHSFSFSRVLFLQSFCWFILKIKAKITNLCLRKHLAFLFCWRYRKPLTPLTLRVTIVHTFNADIIAFGSLCFRHTPHTNSFLLVAWRKQWYDKSLRGQTVWSHEYKAWTCVFIVLDN